MTSIESLDQLEPLGLEIEGEVVEGLPLVWMKGTTVEAGRQVTFRSAMGVSKARELAAAIVGICDALEQS